MGLMQNILGKKAEKQGRDLVGRAFRTFSGYSPTFSTFKGGVYELELTRAAIDRFATACSKLKPEHTGSALPKLARAFDFSMPNRYMTWPKFLYRTATILECDCNAYIVCAYDEMGNKTGIYPLRTDNIPEVVEYAGEAWMRFTFPSGEVAAVPLSEVVILNKFQYEDDFFGSPNVLQPTMDLLVNQNKAQKEAIRAGASIQWIGRVNGQVREDELVGKRNKFSEDNLSQENTTGLMIYDNTFAEIQQVKPYNYTISEGEMNRIRENVYDYFGTNPDILRNHYNEDHWNAFYEGRVEPFALQLGEGLTQMLYTQTERKRNRISFSSNRLEYATSASKRNMIRDMSDRGMMTPNEAREILQMPPYDPAEFGDFGDTPVIRGEYVDATMLNSQKRDKDPSMHDQTKKDTDKRGTTDDEGLEA